MAHVQDVPGVYGERIVSKDVNFVVCSSCRGAGTVSKAYAAVGGEQDQLGFGRGNRNTKIVEVPCHEEGCENGLIRVEVPNEYEQKEQLYGWRYEENSDYE